MVGLIGGVVISGAVGPRCRTAYWVAVLDRAPRFDDKLVAASNLSATEPGWTALRARLRSPDAVVRSVAAYKLPRSPQVYAVWSLLGEIPEHDTHARVEFIRGLEDWWWIREQTLGALYVELGNAHDPKVRAAITEVLENAREADSRVRALHAKFAPQERH